MPHPKCIWGEVFIVYVVCEIQKMFEMVFWILPNGSEKSIRPHLDRAVTCGVQGTDHEDRIRTADG